MKCRLICVLLFVIPALANAAYADPVAFNFETGNLAGWVTFGNVNNVQVLSALGSISPPGGHSYFALLSNGPGEINDPTVAVDQAGLRSDSFLVSPGDSLSLRLAFLTAESIDGWGLPDFFSVGANGSPSLPLASGSVDESLSEIPGGPVVAPDGTTLQYWSGFLNVGPLSLESLAGQSISLEFLVSDYLDNSFDSALLIDNVVIANGPPIPTPIPEPSTLVLFAAGAGFWVVWRKSGLAFGVRGETKGGRITG